jgi:hypothetical protein
VFALACLFPARLRRPLIFRLAVEILGPDTPKGPDVTAAWRYPVFRRAFQVITVAWGVGYLVEAGIRVAVIAQTSTGFALVFSKLVPYAFALALSAWTLACGEHEKKKPSAPPTKSRAHRPTKGRARRLIQAYTLVRCPAR